MSSETFSVILWCWHDLQTGATQLRAMRIDTAEEIRLKESTFLLRISTDERGLERCLIRHLTSGHDAYIQGGPNLRAFVQACVLSSSESEPPATETPGG